MPLAAGADPADARYRVSSAMSAAWSPMRSMIGNHLQRRGDLPQVPGHGLLLQQQLQAQGLDVPLLLVDLPLRSQRGLRQAPSSPFSRAFAAAEMASSHRAPMLDQFHVQLFQLLVKFVTCLLIIRTSR